MDDEDNLHKLDVQHDCLPKVDGSRQFDAPKIPGSMGWRLRHLCKEPREQLRRIVVAEDHVGILARRSAALRRRGNPGRVEDDEVKGCLMFRAFKCFQSVPQLKVQPNLECPNGDAMMDHTIWPVDFYGPDGTMLKPCKSTFTI